MNALVLVPVVRSLKKFTMVTARLMMAMPTARVEDDFLCRLLRAVAAEAQDQIETRNDDRERDDVHVVAGGVDDVVDDDVGSAVEMPGMFVAATPAPVSMPPQLPPG